MDRHDIAHYGSSVALAGGIAASVMMHPKEPASWPVVTADQAAAIVTQAKAVIGDDTLNVYCMDRDCGKITAVLRRAADTLHVKFHSERPIAVPDGPSVGAKTQADADKIALAVKTATNGAIDPDAVANQPVTYISFGRFVSADE